MSRARNDHPPGRLGPVNLTLILFAATVSIAVGLLVIAVPLLMRGGRDELWSARSWVIPLLAAIVAMIAVLSLAIAGGALGLLTTGLGAVSAGFALLALSRPTTFAIGDSGWFRVAMAAVLIVSVSVVVVEFLTVST